MKALILAAGRGERMRPLTDHTPKPLLHVGGKALIVWQIEALVRAGFSDIVINHAHLGAQLPAALGDGADFGARIAYSPEAQPLGTAGGLATARSLLGDGLALVVAGDLYTDFDYERLHDRAAQMREDGTRLHMVMVPNPSFHPAGDFGLIDGRLVREGGERLTFGSIGVYDLSLVADVPAHSVVELTPLYRRWVDAAWVSGERFDGLWENVGTPTQLSALDQALLTHAR